MKIHFSINGIFYLFKPIIPRGIQLWLRRLLVKRKHKKFSNIWPIDYQSADPPSGWTGWPNNKDFAVVLTHDVESQNGHDDCLKLMELEKQLLTREILVVFQ